MRFWTTYFFVHSSTLQLQSSVGSPKHFDGNLDAPVFRAHLRDFSPLQHGFHFLQFGSSYWPNEAVAFCWEGSRCVNLITPWRVRGFASVEMVYRSSIGLVKDFRPSNYLIMRRTSQSFALKICNFTNTNYGGSSISVTNANFFPRTLGAYN